MTGRILRTHESVISAHMGDQISENLIRRINVTRKIRYLVVYTNWDQEILKGQKWIDLCCWSIIGFSVLYFGAVCLKLLIR